nr:hypothetical protein [Tanacetum cinerariifolium]
MCEIFCQFVQKKQEEKRIEKEQVAKAQTWKLSDDDDDEESSNSLNDNISDLPPFSAITPDEPVISTEEPDNSLSMGDEHLDTIPVTESDEVIKSGVENLIPIPNTIEDLSESNEEFSSTDDDSFSLDNIDYVEASPPNSELVSSKVMEIVIPEVGGIKASNDNPIPSYDPIISGTPPNLTPSRENLDPEGDMLLFESFLNDDPSFDSQTKSSSTSFNSLLEETHTFDNSLPECTTFSNVLCEFVGELTLLKSIPPGIDKTDCHPEKEIRLTKRLLYDNSSPRPPEEFVSDNSNADIKSFSPSPIPIKDSDSHMEEIELSLNPDEPNSRDFTKDVVDDISPTKEPQVLNALPTYPTLQLNMKFQPSSESFFAYVVWIFLPFLVYSVVPCYLLSLRNEYIIFDPGICKYHFSKPDISHRCETVKQFNTHRSHLNTFPMLIHGKNISLLDVPLFHFYPP